MVDGTNQDARCGGAGSVAGGWLVHVVGRWGRVMGLVGCVVVCVVGGAGGVGLDEVGMSRAGGGLLGSQPGVRATKPVGHRFGKPLVVVGVPHPTHARGMIGAGWYEGRVEGFAPEVIKEAAAAVGLEVEFEILNLDDDVVALERGVVDAMAPMSVVDGRIGRVAFTTPLMISRGGVYSMPGTPVARVPEDFAGKRVVAAQFGIGHQWCIERAVSVTPTMSLRAAFEAVRTGAAEYVVTTIPSARYELEVARMSGFVETPLADERIVRAFGVAVRSEDSALLADLDTGLAILRDNGRFAQLYDQLMAKYQPREAPLQVSRTLVVWVGGVVGALVLVLAVMYAVSQRRLAKRTRLMLVQESQLAAVTQAVPALVYSYFLGDDGRRELRFANRLMEEWRQRYPRLDLGKSYKDTIIQDIHPEDRPMYEEASTKAATNKTPFDVVFRLKDSEGKYRWIHSALTPFAQPGGTLWQGLIQDLSQSYRAAQQVRESRERYARIFEGCHDAIVVFRPRGEQILEVNERACELYGYTRQEMLSMSLRAVSVDVKAGEQLVSKSEKIGWYESFDWRQRRKDGTIIDVHVSGHVVEFDGQPAILSLTRDVTERKRERQAAERERRVFLGGPTVVCRWVNEPGYPIEHVSANVAQFGYTVEELVSGRVPSDVVVHPDDLPRVVGEIARAERTFEASLETDYRILTKSGEPRWVHGFIAMVRDSAGVTTHLEGCVTDQTSLRNAEEERRQLERQFWQSQRLESLGVLVGGVAHDFNNLLVGILANAHLLGKSLTPESAEGRAAGLIVTAAGRAADLTRQMLAYAGGQPIAPRPVDLTRVAAECAELISRMHPEAAQVEVTPAKGELIAEADEVQMSQVVMNLISNAVEACGMGASGKGRVVIAIEATEVKRTELNRMILGPQAMPGCFVCVEVTDDGLGMDDETRLKIFDPFFTTKATGHGLGLAAVLGIVRAHRGAIEVESAIGRGTRIRVLIPMSVAAIATVEVKPTKVGPGEHRVLIVDDEALVRETVELSLRSAGCETFSFATGAEAIEAVRAGLRVDAAFVDRRMPGMSGEETLAGLRELIPGLAIIIASGLADQRVVEGLTRMERVVYLPKPFAPMDLTDCLARLFAEGVRAPGGDPASMKGKHPTHS